MKSASNIPFTDFGGEGERLHFAHANGYPPGCYGQLIDEMKQTHHVISMHFRPLWKDSDYRRLRNWKIFADDLIRFLDQKGYRDLIGIGHSMGASTTLVVAEQRPDLFKKLILIEPVILPGFVYWISRLPMFLKRNLIPIVKIAERRKDRWESKEALYRSYRKKKIFSKISDNGLKLFAEFATIRDKDGVRLLYSKEWEARVYSTPFSPWKYLRELEQPTLIIRGKNTDVLIDKTWQKLQDTIRNGTFINIENSGHLVPLEVPEKIGTMIKDWLTKH